MATITVTTNADSGAGSLRQACTSAVSGDTIDFSASLKGTTITFTSGQISLTNKELTIDAGILLTGNTPGITFKHNGGAADRRHFTVTNSGMTVIGVKFVGAVNPIGSGLNYVCGSLYFTGSTGTATFNQCQWEACTFSIGGAIYTTIPLVIGDYCTFTNCTVTGPVGTNGAVGNGANAGNGTNGNNASGGAIASTGTVTVGNNCTFSGCQATGGGGGLGGSSTYLSGRQAYHAGNGSWGGAGQGGAIYATVITIGSNCSFLTCKATGGYGGSGGAGCGTGLASGYGGNGGSGAAGGIGRGAAVYATSMFTIGENCVFTSCVNTGGYGGDGGNGGASGGTTYGPGFPGQSGPGGSAEGTCYSQGADQVVLLPGAAFNLCSSVGGAGGANGKEGGGGISPSYSSRTAGSGGMACGACVSADFLLINPNCSFTNATCTPGTGGNQGGWGYVTNYAGVGGSGYGGAIKATGAAILGNCTFNNCIVNGARGGNGSNYSGNGPYSTNGKSAGNGGNAYGGAIYTSGKLIITGGGTSIIACATWGGAGGTGGNAYPGGVNGNGGQGGCAYGGGICAACFEIDSCDINGCVVNGGYGGAAGTGGTGGTSYGSVCNSAAGAGVFTDCTADSYLTNSIIRSCFNRMTSGTGPVGGSITSSGTSATLCNVINCTIVNCGSHVSQCPGVVAVNANHLQIYNTFVLGCFYNYSTTTQYEYNVTSNCVISNSITSAGQTTNIFENYNPSTSHTRLKAVAGYSTSWSAAQYATGLRTAWTNNNYSVYLKDASPAIDAGNNTLSLRSDGASIPFDKDGKQRSIGGTVDIGCYEYGTPQKIPTLELISVTNVSATLLWGSV